MMARLLLRNLLVNIRNAKFFALIADETRDISGLEQFAISLRWVDDSYKVYEDLIGLVQVDTTDAATLSGAIKDMLIRCIIDLHNSMQTHMETLMKLVEESRTVHPHKSS